MFEQLAAIVPDPILGLMAAFRADPDPRKVDLGVGVYRDEHGNTPVPEAVRRAEAALLARQTTKTRQWSCWCSGPRIRRWQRAGYAACRPPAAVVRYGSERS